MSRPVVTVGWDGLPSLREVYADRWALNADQITPELSQVASRYLRDVASGDQAAFAPPQLRDLIALELWPAGKLSRRQARDTLNILGLLLRCLKAALPEGSTAQRATRGERGPGVPRLRERPAGRGLDTTRRRTQLLRPRRQRQNCDPDHATVARRRGPSPPTNHCRRPTRSNLAAKQANSCVQA